MDAAVSLHHAAFPLPLPLPAPAPPHHCALPLPPPLQFHHLRHPSARLGVAVTAPRPGRAEPARSSSSSSSSPRVLATAAVPTHSSSTTSSSSRAATGYAAALTDASLRAGTLRRASRHAHALLRGRRRLRVELVDARVEALVRMLAAKGKAGMVAEVLAEFAAICDRLLPTPARSRASSSSY